MKNLLFLFFVGQALFSQDRPKPEDTEVWEPEPVVVIPGKSSNPPSDAIVLFDGTDFSKWQHEQSKKPVQWTLNKDNSMTVKPRTGGIETIEEHGYIQFHSERKTPSIIKGKGQGRGNSGIMFQRRYEVQVLDSYNNRTYSNGQASSIYKQHIPLVNATRKPGEWQVYDIVFNEPKYDDEGIQIKSGTLTIFHNGILIHNKTKILGTTSFIGMHETNKDSFPLDGQKGGTHRSLLLQDHGDGKVSYRNIWMRKL